MVYYMLTKEHEKGRKTDKLQSRKIYPFIFFWTNYYKLAK